MKRILIGMLFVLSVLSIGIVEGLTYFKNAILLDEGINTFGIRLNDSFEVTEDINVTLLNDTPSLAPNLLGYSSKTNINVDDVIFYKQDGSSLGYQDAKSNNWIEGINLSTEGITGEEATILTEYNGYWITSALAVKVKFPNIGGSNVSKSTNISYKDVLLYNGTNYLNITSAKIEGWINSEIIIYWDDSANGFSNAVCALTGRGAPSPNCNKIHFNTWEGYIITTLKPNIHMLFENKTITVNEYELIVWINKNEVPIIKYKEVIQPSKLDWVIKKVKNIIWFLR